MHVTQWHLTQAGQCFQPPERPGGAALSQHQVPPPDGQQGGGQAGQHSVQAHGLQQPHGLFHLSLPPSTFLRCLPSTNIPPQSVPQEKDITPDPQLMDKVNECSSQMDFMRFHSQPMSQLPSDLSDIIDFFIALTICNTVVVSSPNQPRHKVKPLLLFFFYCFFFYTRVFCYCENLCGSTNSRV